MIEKSIRMVEQWVEAHDYKGYEPFDGLSSIFRPLTFGNLFLNRLLLQLIRQSPWNLRPLLGVRPLDSTIGRGYMAWGYCYMFKLTSDQKYRERIDACLEWLIENKSPAYDEYSWGKHFDFASRSGLYVAFEPILVWTALIAHAFLEAYEVCGNGKYLDVADSVCRWIMKLPRNQTDKGFCMGYHYQDLAADIHNSNMVGAAVLARTAKYTGNQEYLAAAKGAMRYSCTRQLPDGSWLYGEGPGNHWIDNFHTGYNLDSLLYYIESSGDTTYRPHLDRGLAFYKAHFFEEDGRPRYYHTRTYPVDIQCAAQAIDTLATFSARAPESRELAKKVAAWTIRNMQGPQGYFYYREYPLMKAKTPMLHWGQATMFKALTHLSLVLQSADSTERRSV